MTDEEREVREYLAGQRRLSGWAREDNCDRLVLLLRLLDTERKKSAKAESMTDDKREARIRQRMDDWADQDQAAEPSRKDVVSCSDVWFLRGLLDAERAKISWLEAERDRIGQLLRSISEPMPPVGGSRRPKP
jgi:hypothetical protein